MNRLEFELNIIYALDDACNNLSTQEFDKLLERIKETIEDYE